MELGFLANIAGVAAPGAGVAIHAAGALAKGVENVKVNKFQAQELSRRCTQLALACEEACKGLEGTEFSSITDEITAVIEKASRRAQEWSSMNAVRSFAMQSSIRQGIDSLFKDIDTLNHRFHIVTLARMHKTQQEMDQIRERDKDENLEMMRNIFEHVTMRGNNMQQSQPSQSTNAIQIIREILTEGAPEERESLQRQLREILGPSGANSLENQIPLELVPNPSPTRARKSPNSEYPDDLLDSRTRLFSRDRSRVTASHSRSPKSNNRELEPVDEQRPSTSTSFVHSPSLVWSTRRQSNDIGYSHPAPFAPQRRPSELSDFDYNGEEDADDSQAIPNTSSPRHPLIHDSPLHRPRDLEPSNEHDSIAAQMANLGRLGEQLDERLKFDSFGGRRHTLPSGLLYPPTLHTPETSDSAHSNSPGSSPHSPPSSFGGSSPALHPRARSGSSTSSFMLSGEMSLLDCEGLDLTSFVQRNPKGYVLAGTLAGLVDELLRKSTNGYQKTQDFQEMFLTSYRLFDIGPEPLRDVLKLLFRRFTLSESTSDPTFRVEDRVPIRHEVLVVLKMLLNKHYSNAIELPVLEELLPTIQGISSSSYFAAQSKDLVTAIERLMVACGQQNRFKMTRLAKPLAEPMHLVDFDHKSLAFAMRLLEGAAYKQLTPTDCVTHLLDPDAASPLAEARAINNKLYNWVRRKVLSRDNLSDRRNTLQTFISVAHECRVERNFASMSAIVAAIESPALSNLRSTRRSLDKEAVKVLNSLKATLDSARDYHEYTRLLQNRSSKKGEACIPWLSHHVNRLKYIHANQSSHVMVEGRRLISFERYRRLSAEIVEFLKYQDAHIYPSQQITFPALSYLEDELKKIKKNEQAGKAIEVLSLERQAQEDRDYNS